MRRPGQGFTLWFTGLPCSGKSTLARAVSRCLSSSGLPVEELDGDLVRKKLSRGLGFSTKDRMANVERVSFVAGLLTRQGVVAVVSLVSPYRKMRAAARKSAGNFIEIYTRCPIRVCEKRDVKGMYRLARKGKIRRFTGVSDPYEEPVAPEIVVDTDRMTVKACVESVMAYLAEKNLLPAPNPFAGSVKLSRTYDFAARYHWGQTRVGGAPYIVHPLAVARALRAAGYSEDVAAAGLLHDVLEDTGCELEKIVKLAGPRVARWVAEVTDKDKTADWKKRKKNYLEGLKKASKEALAVACADKTDNIASIAEGLARSPKFASRFQTKMKDKIANYENVYRVIRVRYPSCPLLSDYRFRLDRLRAAVSG